MKKMYTTIRQIAAIGGVVGAVVLIIGLLFHIQALSRQIQELEAQTAGLELKLASFDKRLCSEGAAPLRGSLQTHRLQSAGYQRTYRVHTPAHYDPSVRYPLILSFDGVEGSGARMQMYSNLDTIPAIVVYPDALKGTKGFTAWQGAPYSVEGERDMQFVRELLETLPGQYCIDATRQYAVGMSNGGAFAATVGCELGDQIRAVASVSGAFYTTCQREERTPSLLLIHSLADKQVPYLGEKARKLPKIQQWASEQASSRACKTSLPVYTENSTTYYNWLDCSDSSLLRLIVVRNQPHGWLTLPVNAKQGADTTAEYIWRFFESASFNGS